jgi:DNA-directed RNA polymerase subunit RPC12/RpoP
MFARRIWRTPFHPGRISVVDSTGRRWVKYMPVQTVCDFCSVKITFADDRIGEAVKCPKCGERIVVPADGNAASRTERAALPDGLPT